LVRAVLSLFLLVTKRLYGKEWEWSIGQIKTCRKKQHVEIDDMKEMSDLFCGKAAVGGNYNSTRDNIYKIKMYLHNQSKEDIYISRSIPIFTEDAEARLFLRCIFDSFERNGNGTFSQVRSLFHFVEANISGDALVNIFSDDKLLRSTMRSICIVDGDKKAQHKLENYTIALPGDKSPEELVFEYANELYLNDDVFWLDSTIISLGFTKVYFRDNVLVDINKIEEKIKELKKNEDSTKGVKRDSNKKVFNKYKRFFEIVMRKWIADHEEKINYFYHNLHILFCKVSEFHDINPKEWIE